MVLAELDDTVENEALLPLRKQERQRQTDEVAPSRAAPVLRGMTVVVFTIVAAAAAFRGATPGGARPAGAQLQEVSEPRAASASAMATASTIASLSSSSDDDDDDDDESGCAIVPTNEYGGQPESMRLYTGFGAIVEPHRITQLAVSRLTGYANVTLHVSAANATAWRAVVAAVDAGTGVATHAHAFDVAAADYWVVAATADGARSCRRRLTCKYVRRELRTLTADDRERYLSALEVMLKTDDAEGKAAYGVDFVSGVWFTRWHLARTGETGQTPYHNSPSFFTSHAAFFSLFERSLQVRPVGARFLCSSSLLPSRSSSAAPGARVLCARARRAVSSLGFGVCLVLLGLSTASDSDRRCRVLHRRRARKPRPSPTARSATPAPGDRRAQRRALLGLDGRRDQLDRVLLLVRRVVRPDLRCDARERPLVGGRRERRRGR